MQVTIPFGKEQIIFAVPEDLDCEVLRSQPVPVPAGVSQDDLVLKALGNPIGSPRLSQLAQGKKTATIICSDHTRPVPSRHILPHMLKELRQGNPAIKVTLLIATGCHRHTTREELVGKLGEELVAQERIVVHDCTDAASCQEIGVLPSGAKLIINKVAIETDLLVSEGFIEPHFFAGFSGGRKSVLPGICSRTTVLGNHCAEFIASPYARTGILEGNPIHKDMLAAAKLAKLQFIVNVLIDDRHKAIDAYAGDPFQAHEAGCQALSSHAVVHPQRLGDIVITSNGGYPLDQNIYQSVKGLTAAEAAAAPGAAIITVTRCADGNGGNAFYHHFADCTTVQSLADEILKVPQDKTVPDQWESQILARIMLAHKVTFVSDPEVRDQIENMKLSFASTLDEAFAAALQEKGRNCKLTIIPDGVSVIVK